MKKLVVLAALLSGGLLHAEEPNAKAREEIGNTYRAELYKLAADLKKCKEYCSSVGPKKEESNSTDEDKDKCMQEAEKDCQIHCEILFESKYLHLKSQAAKKPFELFKKENNY
jgi:hypothetical protein